LWLGRVANPKPTGSKAIAQFNHGKSDEISGLVHVSYAVASNATTGPFTVSILGVGTTSQILDLTGNLIPFTPTNGIVTLTAVPEPSSLLLLSSALIVVPLTSLARRRLARRGLGSCDKELFAWPEAGAHVFVPGDAKRVAVDVDRALREVSGSKAAGTTTQPRRKSSESTEDQVRSVLPGMRRPFCSQKQRSSMLK
jgi:hypothetical protein